MNATEQQQSVQGTLLLRELTTLLHSNPVRLGGHISYSLAFQTLPNKSSKRSNWDRNTDDLPEHIQCTRDTNGGHFGGPTAPRSSKTVLGVDQQRGRWLVIEYLAGILASIAPAEIPSPVKTVDW